MNQKGPEFIKKMELIISLGLLLFGAVACGPTIEAGSKVYVKGKGVSGTYPFSQSVNGTTCSVKPGEYEVQATDPQFNILLLDGCWVYPGGITTKPPTPTSTPYPTPNVWIKATSPFPTPKSSQ